MHTVRRESLLVAAILVVVLSGCGAEPEPTPTPSGIPRCPDASVLTAVGYFLLTQENAGESLYCVYEAPGGADASVNVNRSVSATRSVEEMNERFSSAAGAIPDRVAELPGSVYFFYASGNPADRAHIAYMYGADETGSISFTGSMTIPDDYGVDRDVALAVLSDLYRISIGSIRPTGGQNAPDTSGAAPDRATSSGSTGSAGRSGAPQTAGVGGCPAASSVARLGEFTTVDPLETASQVRCRYSWGDSQYDLTVRAAFDPAASAEVRGWNEGLGDAARRLDADAPNLPERVNVLPGEVYFQYWDGDVDLFGDRSGFLFGVVEDGTVYVEGDVKVPATADAGRDEILATLGEIAMAATDRLMSRQTPTVQSGPINWLRTTQVWDIPRHDERRGRGCHSSRGRGQRRVKARREVPMIARSRAILGDMEKSLGPYIGSQAVRHVWTFFRWWIVYLLGFPFVTSAMVAIALLFDGPLERTVRIVGIFAWGMGLPIMSGVSLLRAKFAAAEYNELPKSAGPRINVLEPSKARQSLERLGRQFWPLA
jgi:hypothetical protein